MNTVRIDYSKKFIKRLGKTPRRIRIAFRNRLEVFISDKFNPVLNNHALTGKFKGYRSINVTGDWRAIFKEYDSGKIVYFVAIDTHSNLYK